MIDSSTNKILLTNLFQSVKFFFQFLPQGYTHNPLIIGLYIYE